jgi:hypothetical protein
LFVTRSALADEAAPSADDGLAWLLRFNRIGVTRC